MTQYNPGEILLEKYLIEAFLGRGSFAEVYRVTFTPLNQVRALKILKRENSGLSAQEYARKEQRFQAEYLLGAQLNSPNPHPHLLMIYEPVLAEDLLGVAMEFAPGGNLQKRIEQSALRELPLPLETCLRIARDVALGLARLHKLDIVHRDLKPANILFDQDDYARVGDLGLVQTLEDWSERTQLSDPPPHPGTPGYKSPEQVETRDPLKTSSDMYALGVVLFEMLTGRKYILARAGIRASELRKDVPASVDALLARLLAKNPDERPNDGGEAAKLLGQLLGERPEVVRPGGAVRPNTPMPPATEPATGGLKISAQVTLHRPEDLPEAARRDWDGTLETLLEPAGEGGLLDWLEQDVLAAAKRERDRPRRDAVNKVIESVRKYQKLISAEQDDLRQQELFTEFLMKLDGYQPASIGLDPAAGLDFGPLDEKTGKQQRTLRVSNLGGDLLVYRLESAEPAVRVIDPVAGRLQAGESADIQVELNGTVIPAQPGPGELQMNLRTNQGLREVAVRYFVEKAVLQVEPQVLQFDPGRAGQEQQVQISNIGTGELSVELSSELDWLQLVSERKFILLAGARTGARLKIRTGAPPLFGAIVSAGFLVHSNVGDVDIGIECLPDEQKLSHLREEQSVRQRIVTIVQRKKEMDEKARHEAEERARLEEQEARQAAEKQRRQKELVLKLAPGVTMEFVRVPAGEFTMGSEKYDSEKPVHKVTLPEYLIGKQPVTNRQYQVYVQAGGKTPKHWASGKIPAGKEDHPVVYVSWEDASAFCGWVSKKSGMNVRLPGEAEWEKAARGTDGREYPWGNQAPDDKRCNYKGNAQGTTPIGKYSPQGDSPYGCVDMAGNVREWTADWYQAYPGNMVANTEYGEKYRVLRGGVWYYGYDYFVRTALRDWDGPTDSNDDIGFRCARSD